MNPLARELNEQIRTASSETYEMFSELGKQIFFPKGILSQSAEAKKKATKFNATIGIATEKGVPMHLPVTRQFFSELSPAEVYPYAPPAGRPQLRKLWKEKMLSENEILTGKSISQPIVTNALTHGTSIVADLFVDQEDVVLLPDKFWGNYRLTFVVRRGAVIQTYPLFNASSGYNTKGLAKALNEIPKGKKVIVILNFPNNPTGYTFTRTEAEKTTQILATEAQKGRKIVIVSDDAYFGLFYEECFQESIFGLLCDIHPNILAIKLDGATKEEYAWGFRTGFITFGTVSNDYESLYSALEKKVMGIIRATISNCAHSSQSIIEKILVDSSFEKEKQEKYQLMKSRANRVKEVLKEKRFESHWEYYPFNSGYFMCLKLKKVEAEQLRKHLLDQYGVGTIALGKTDLRIAFSCIEEESIEELFHLILAGCNDLS